MNKKGLLVVGIFLIFLINGIYATLNVSLSDQGTNAKYKSNGSVINSGDLEVTIYDDLTGGNLIYNETFAGVINNGSWNVMLGENSSNNLSLEFGKIYYKDYRINGQDLNFTDFYGNEVGRRFFYSPLGDVGGEDISSISNVTIASLNVSGVLYANGSSLGIGTSNPQGLFNLNGSSLLYFDNTDNLVALRLRRFGTVLTGSNSNFIGVVQGRALDSLGNEWPFGEMAILAMDITDGLEKGAIVFKTSENAVFTEQMRIGYNGYVGIGTNSSIRRLQVNSDATENVVALFNSSGPTLVDMQSAASQDVGIRLTETGGGEWTLGLDNSDSDKFKISYAATWPGDGTTGLTINSTGHVGIGTTNPTSKLHINDTTTTLRIESNDASHKDQAALVIGGKWGDSTAAYASLVLGSDGTTDTLDDTYRLQVFDGTAWKVPLLLYKNGDMALSGTAAGASPIMYLNDSSGNVGIETSNPTHTLNVVGDLNVTGTSYLGDLIIDADNITVNNIISKGGNITFYNSTNDEIVRFTDDGKVGIGTTNPNATLEIKTATANNTIFRLESTAADSYPNIRFVNDAREWRIFAPDGSQGDAFVIYDGTAPATRFAIDTNGDVGIGTPSPDAKLEIETSAVNDAALQLKSTAANSYPNIKFVNDVREWRIYGADGSQGDAFIIYDGTALGTRFAIDTSGEVGIGTAYPNSLLEIKKRGGAGYNLNVSGLLYVNDTNVGIGTSSSNNALEVYGGVDGAVNDLIKLNSPTGTTGVAQMITTGLFTKFGVVNDAASTVSFQISNTSNYAKFYVGTLGTYDGRVGINTTTPTHTLNVVGDLNVTGTSYLGNLIIDAENITFDNAISKSGNIVFWNTTGSELMRVSGNGNVGIGTANPTEKLTVRGGGANTYLAVRTANGASTDPILALVSANNSYGGIYTAANYPLYLGTNNNVGRMTLSTSGYLGIGTTTPTHTLNVVGDLNVTGTSYLGDLIISADNITTNNIISKSGNITFWSSTNDEIVRFVDNGNVGIGTSSPGSILDVRQYANGGPATLRIENTYALAGSTDETIDIQGRFADTSNVSEYAFRLLGIKEQDYSAAANMDASLAISVALNGGYNEAIRILSNGRVGIGNSTPSDTLEVQGGVTANGAFTSDVANDGGMTIHQTVGGGGGIAYNIRTSNGGGWAWRFVDGTATSPVNEYFKVTYSSGNTWVKGILQVAGTGDSAINGSLGIGTATPTHELNVIGDINVTGVSYLQDNITLIPPGGGTTGYIWNNGTHIIID